MCLFSTMLQLTSSPRHVFFVHGSSVALRVTWGSSKPRRSRRCPCSATWNSGSCSTFLWLGEDFRADPNMTAWLQQKGAMGKPWENGGLMLMNGDFKVFFG